MAVRERGLLVPLVPSPCPALQARSKHNLITHQGQTPARLGPGNQGLSGCVSASSWLSCNDVQELLGQLGTLHGQPFTSWLRWAALGRLHATSGVASVAKLGPCLQIALHACRDEACVK